MTSFLSSSTRWKCKIPNDSVYDLSLISCCFNQSRRHKRVKNLVVFSSSLVTYSQTSKQVKKTSRIRHGIGESCVIHNGEEKTVEEELKAEFLANCKNLIPVQSKSTRPFWQNLLFGSKKFKSIVLLNIITVVYASNIPVVKEVEASIDPAAFSAVRFVMSAIPFLPFVFQARDDTQIRNAGTELGLWISLGYLIEAFALLTADAGRASFISLFTVIVVPLLESLLGAIIPARTWFGLLMSVLGNTMLECSGSPPNVGDFLNFLSAIFFGIHMLRTEHISRATKKENLLAILGYEVCVVALFSTIWFLIGGCFEGTQGCDGVPWTWTMLWNSMEAFPWIPALYTGIFSTGLCLWAEITAMRDVSAMETAVIYGLEPLWGAGFAWFLLGERWGLAGWIGAALVLGGSLTVQLFGSIPAEFTKVEESDKKDGLLGVSDKQKLRNASLSAAPVVISSRKVVVDTMLEK